MVTFSKLVDGTWGVRIDGGEFELCERKIADGMGLNGVEATATKRDGTEKAVIIDALVKRGNGFIVCSIQEKKKAWSGPRNYRRTYEQASLASQQAPYDLAPTAAYSAREVAFQAGRRDRERAPAPESKPALTFADLLGKPSLLSAESTLTRE